MNLATNAQCFFTGFSGEAYLVETGHRSKPVSCKPAAHGCVSVLTCTPTTTRVLVHFSLQQMTPKVSATARLVERRVFLENDA